MRTFEVPKRASIELPHQLRLEVSVASIQPTGLWCVPPQPITLAFRANLRVIFPSEQGALGVNAEVVCSGAGGGFGVLLLPDTDAMTRAVFLSWSKGQAAVLENARPDRRPAMHEQITDDLPRRERPPINIPVEPTSPMNRPRRSAELRTQLAGRTVLVVDDDALSAHALRTALSKRGGSIYVANDGLAALDLVRARRLDAVLLDWMLPVMSGARLLDEIRKGAPKLPVAVVSGVLGTSSMRAAVKKAGADEAFPKPYELGRITDWIASCPPA